MITAGNEQIEEYRHRIGNNIFRLNKVNAEIIYFLDKNGKLEEIFSGINDYKDRLFHALGSTDHTQRVAFGKELMKDLWEIELGLGSYPFAEILSQFEFDRHFYKGYRDHVLHQLRVYLLGIYLYYGCKKIQKLFITHQESTPLKKQSSEKDFLRQWKIAALSHDHGYVFEVEGGERSQWVINKILPILNNKIGFPLSSLSETVRKNAFCQSGSTQKDYVINCLHQRAISYNREKDLQSALEIVPPSVQSVRDLLFFRGDDLLQHLDWVGTVTRLSLPNTNGLKAYYEFASKYGPGAQRLAFRDHGITSALFLLLQGKFNEYYSDKLSHIKSLSLVPISLPEETVAFINSISELFKSYTKNIHIAAAAVALHNISKSIWQDPEINLTIAERDYNLTLFDFVIHQNAIPLAFLLSLVDILQDWDRPSFISKSADDILDYQSDQDMSVTLDKEHIYLSFPNKASLESDPFKKFKKAFKEILDSEFIDELIQELPWKGLGAYHLTDEAEEVELHSLRMADIVPSKDLKSMIALQKKNNRFEYTLSVDFSKEKDFLRLVRDLVALANSEGGIFVIGINDDPFLTLGITEKTYLPDYKRLIDTINLFCTTPLNFFSGRQTIKMPPENKMKTFYVFHVQKSSKLIVLNKSGQLRETNSRIFEKYEIPLRQDGTTVGVGEAYILEVFAHAQINNDREMMYSVLDLQRTGIIPREICPIPLPGVLPIPDFDKLIGRDIEIKQLLEFLDSPKIFSITIDGIGGSGKSALALEVMHNIKNRTYISGFDKFKLKNNFQAVVWVTAKTLEFTSKGFTPRFGAPVTLDILLDRIAESMELPELKDMDYEEKKASIIDLLTTIRCLIVVDNLETVPDTHKEEIISFVENDLPLPSKVIFTTRTKFHTGYSIRVMELKHEDALFLAKNLAVELGNYLLADNVQLIEKISQRTGQIPLGIKWTISRICLGFVSVESIGDIVDDLALLRFCFEETFNYLTEKEKNILFAISICDFVPDIDNIEYLTGLSKTELINGLERLESFSLIKMQVNNVFILPLTKEYSRYNLEQKPSLTKKLHSRIQELFQLDQGIVSSLPVNKRMALRLFKEAAFESGQANYSKALKQLEEAKKLSNEPYIMKAMAEVCEKQDGLENALELYQSYVEVNPDDYEILFKLGYYFKKVDKLPLALKYLTMATEAKTDNKDFWHYRGLIEKLLSAQYGKRTFKGKKYSELSIESFKQAIREPARSGQERHLNAINYHLMAQCLVQKSDLKKACEACLLGLKDEPLNNQLKSFALRFGCATEEAINKIIQEHLSKIEI